MQLSNLVATPAQICPLASQRPCNCVCVYVEEGPPTTLAGCALYSHTIAKGKENTEASAAQRASFRRTGLEFVNSGLIDRTSVMRVSMEPLRQLHADLFEVRSACWESQQQVACAPINAACSHAVC